MTEHFNILCLLCSPSTTPDDLSELSIDWRAIWQLALRHRVVPVMSDRIKHLNIVVPESINQQMAAHNQQNLLKGMRQSAELVFLTHLFQTHNIPFLAFKGLALHHLTGLELNQRHMGDMDILLAKMEDLWRTDQLLQAQGYQRKTPSTGTVLNVPQKKHFLTYDKDMTYWHPEKKINLELHFKLTNNPLLFPVSPAELYANRSDIMLGTTAVPVMSKTDHQIYLLVHGAVSRWFRLKWLCDIPLISRNGRDYDSATLLNRAESLGVERMVIQGLWLAHAQLGMPIPDAVPIQYAANPAIRKLVQLTEQHQLGAEPLHRRFSGRLSGFSFMLSMIFRYAWLLRPETRYKIRQVSVYATHFADWQTFPLPAFLFVLYYPLRPILWLKRHLT